mgnify:CR=1 FL=1
MKKGTHAIIKEAIVASRAQLYKFIRGKRVNVEAFRREDAKKNRISYAEKKCASAPYTQITKRATKQGLIQEKTKIKGELTGPNFTGPKIFSEPQTNTIYHDKNHESYCNHMFIIVS